MRKPITCGPPETALLPGDREGYLADPGDYFAPAKVHAVGTGEETGVSLVSLSLLREVPCLPVEALINLNKKQLSVNGKFENPS